MSTMNRLQDLFLAALDLSDEAAAAMLDRDCAGDPALRQQVQRLLDARRSRKAFLQSPTLQSPLLAADGMLVGGKYRIQHRIGEGGGGCVYLAQQTEPVRRVVALKLIRADEPGEQVIARFEAERQALALMDHPNIARIVDAGTEQGRPYFVMDYVPGRAITTFCDERRLTLAQRLALFEQVCHAVQHAHQKGIIHRDLKPNNILVSERDGEFHATLIDFGIAKATQVPLTNKPLHTMMHGIMGTLEYMSPEQVNSSRDLDTRTDVYSLGIVLYELLAGFSPFDDPALAAADRIHAIRETDAPRPSLALASCESRGKKLALLARDRRIEPRRLLAALRGEIDVIVCKSIEKDPARRYATANALASDVHRHLSGQPISAVPPSAWYWTSKVIRRNKPVVFLAAASLLALAATSVVALAGWRRAGHAQSAAVIARDDAIAAKDVAEQAVVREQESARLAMQREQEALLAREEARHAGYEVSMRGAEIAAAYDERDQARAALDGCPLEMRGWEWDYLNARHDMSIQVLDGHRGPLTAIAFSSDAARLATADEFGVVRVTDLASEELVVLDADDDTISAVAFASEDNRLVTASPSGLVRSWNAATGQLIAELLPRDPTRSVLSLTTAANADVIAAGCADGSIRLLQLDGSPPRVLQAFTPSDGESDDVHFVHLSADGSRLVAATQGRIVQVWDVASEQQTSEFLQHNAPLAGVRIFPDGLTAVSVDTSGVGYIWSTVDRDGVVRFEVHPRGLVDGGISGIALTDDASALAIAWGRYIIIQNLSSRKSIVRLEGHDDEITALAFAHDGRSVASASADSTARVWDAMLPACREYFPASRPSIPSLAPTRDRVVLVEGHRVVVRDLISGEALLDVTPEQISPAGANFSADGSHVIVWPAYAEKTFGRALLLDAHTGESVTALRGLRELESATPDAILNTQGFHRASFSPAGRQIVAPSTGWAAEIYDWATGKRQAVLQGHELGVLGAVFSPQGDVIATWSSDATARIWSAADGSPLRTLVGHEGAVTAARFTQDGILVTEGVDETVRVWRIADGEALGAIPLPSGASAVWTSIDGRRVLIKDDQSLQLVDITTGEELGRVSAVLPMGTPLAVSDDESRVVCVSTDGNMQVWNFTSSNPLLTVRMREPLAGLAFALQGQAVIGVDESGLWVWDAVSISQRASQAAAFRTAISTQSERWLPRLDDATSEAALRRRIAADTRLDPLQRDAAFAAIARHAARDTTPVAQRLERDAAGSMAEREEAVRQARGATERSPKSADAHSRLGVALYHAHRYDEAIAALRVSERLRFASRDADDPEDGFFDPEAAAYVTLSLWRLERHDEARSALRDFRQMMEKHHTNCDHRQYLTFAERQIPAGIDDALVGPPSSLQTR
jgi:eukaryotic-like serine/threonine-protein kinase